MSKIKVKQLENKNGGISYSYYNDLAVIDFCDNDKQLPAELMEFKFVVDSYFESCFILLIEVEKYLSAENIKEKRLSLLKYLPAVFCFRHYIELKLKFLYMKHTGTSFNSNTHDLSVLLKELQNVSGLEYAIFNNSISYIEKMEKTVNNTNFVAFSRYLVDNQFNFQKNINIVLKDVKKIKQNLIEIEGRIETREQIEWFYNLLQQPNGDSKL